MPNPREQPAPALPDISQIASIFMMMLPICTAEAIYMPHSLLGGLPALLRACPRATKAADRRPHF